jgi:hypothetical protein
VAETPIPRPGEGPKTQEEIDRETADLPIRTPDQAPTPSAKEAVPTTEAAVPAAEVAPPPTAPKPEAPKTAQEIEEAKARELQKVREQLGISEAAAEQKARELAHKQFLEQKKAGRPSPELERLKENRGTIWRIKNWFTGGAMHEQVLADRYVRDFERREELEAIQKAGAKLDDHQERELAAIKQRFAEGRGVELSEAERGEIERIASIIDKNADTLNNEDKAVLSRWKNDDWWERYPTLKAALIGGAGGTVAGLLAKTALGGAIRQVALIAGAPVMIGTTVAGALFGGIRKEYTVHHADQWTKDLGLNISDEKLHQLPNEGLTRIVGVARNAIEKNAVRGSKGEYFQFLVKYRKASEELTRRGLEVRGKQATTEAEQKDARLFSLMKEFDQQERNEKDLEEFLKQRLSTVELKTYQSIQRGKGMKVVGGALLGAGIGIAVGSLASFLLDRGSDEVRDLIERFHRDSDFQLQVVGSESGQNVIRAQQERAAIAFENIGARAFGFNEQGLSRFLGEFAQNASPHQLVETAAKAGNIDLGVDVQGQQFVHWLTENRDWFSGLSRDVQAEVLSHPDLAPLLKEAGEKAVAPTIYALIGMGGLAVGALGALTFHHLGKAEIKHDIEASQKRYRTYAEIEKAYPEAVKENRQFNLRQLVLKEGYRPEYKIEGKIWKVVHVDRDPTTEEWAVEVITMDGKEKQILPLTDLLDREKAVLVSFGRPEKKETEKKAGEVKEEGAKKEGAEKGVKKPEQEKTPTQAGTIEEAETKIAELEKEGATTFRRTYLTISGAPSELRVVRSKDGKTIPVFGVMRDLWVKIKGEDLTPDKFDHLYKEWLSENKIKDATGQEGAQEAKPEPKDRGKEKEKDKGKEKAKTKDNEENKEPERPKGKEINKITVGPENARVDVIMGRDWSVKGIEGRVIEFESKNTGTPKVILRDSKGGRHEFAAFLFADPDRAHEVKERSRGRERKPAIAVEHFDQIETPTKGFVVKGDVWTIKGAPYRIDDIVRIGRRIKIHGVLTDQEKFKRRKWESLWTPQAFGKIAERAG